MAGCLRFGRSLTLPILITTFESAASILQFCIIIMVLSINILQILLLFQICDFFVDGPEIQRVDAEFFADVHHLIDVRIGGISPALVAG